MSQSTAAPATFRVRGLDPLFRRDDWPAQIGGYHFDLDPSLIAQSPAPRREDSRLLLIRRHPHGGLPVLEDLQFRDLPEIAEREGLNRSKWVRNRTRVFAARLYAKRPSGSVHEIVLVREITTGKWQAIIRNIKRFDFPQTLQLVSDPHVEFQCTAPGEIDFSKSGLDVFEICERHGEMPLPPYIKERSQERDRERYQTIWAHQQKPASVAAPTASLHFSDSLCASLRSRGVDFLDIELDVGLGTFEPLRQDGIHQNRLHAERFGVKAEARSELEKTLTLNRPLLCVGTTAMRCLESLPLNKNRTRATELECTTNGGWRGETSIFIKPGTDVLYTSQLLTNFHLPESSLFVLVSTFAGSAALAQMAYRHATQKKYRFFSYGDATLWL